MLYIFDKDGCLCPPIVSSNGKTHPPNRVEQQRYYADVLPKTTLLKRAGHKLAVASNQGGVAFGILMLGHAKQLVEAAANHIDAATWRVSPYHPKGKVAPYDVNHIDRKPGPGMLLDIMGELGYTPEQTVMVGDWDSDKEAAEAARCLFIQADTFFERSAAEPYIFWGTEQFDTRPGMVSREVYTLPPEYSPLRSAVYFDKPIRVQIIGMEFESKVTLVEIVNTDPDKRAFAMLNKALVDKLVKA